MPINWAALDEKLSNGGVPPVPGVPRIDWDALDEKLRQNDPLAPASFASPPVPEPQAPPVFAPPPPAAPAPPAPALPPAETLFPQSRLGTEWGTAPTDATQLLPKDRPSAVARGYVTGVQQDFPASTGQAAEAWGYVSGSDYLKGVGKSLQREQADPRYKTSDIDRTRAFDSLGNALTYAGETFGRTMGSMTPMIGGGLLGGVAGGVLAGPGGAIVGAKVGSSLPSYAQNTGELYQQLKEEGMAPEDAAPIAVTVGAVITVPDAYGFGKLEEAVKGTGKTVLIKGLAKRIAATAKNTGKWEGGTEALQGLIRETTAEIAGRANDSKNMPGLGTRVGNVAEDAVWGSVVGGTFGAAAGVRGGPKFVLRGAGVMDADITRMSETEQYDLAKQYMELRQNKEAQRIEELARNNDAAYGPAAREFMFQTGFYYDKLSDRWKLLPGMKAPAQAPQATGAPATPAPALQGPASPAGAPAATPEPPTPPAAVVAPEGQSAPPAAKPISAVAREYLLSSIKQAGFGPAAFVREHLGKRIAELTEGDLAVAQQVLSARRDASLNDANARDVLVSYGVPSAEAARMNTPQAQQAARSIVDLVNSPEAQSLDAMFAEGNMGYFDAQRALEKKTGLVHNALDGTWSVLPSVYATSQKIAGPAAVSPVSPAQTAAAPKPAAAPASTPAPAAATSQELAPPPAAAPAPAATEPVPAPAPAPAAIAATPAPAEPAPAPAPPPPAPAPPAQGKLPRVYRGAQDVAAPVLPTTGLDQEMTAQPPAPPAPESTPASKPTAAPAPAPLVEPTPITDMDPQAVLFPRRSAQAPARTVSDLLSAIPHLVNRVRVVENATQFPEAVRRQAQERHGDIDVVEGFLYPGDGYVYLNRSRLKSIAQTRGVIAHEVAIHLGAREAMGGDAFRAMANDVWAHMPDADKARYAERSKETDPGVLAEEGLAYAAAEVVAAGKSTPVWRRAAAFVRPALRKAGFRVAYNDVEIARIVERGWRGAVQAQEPVVTRRGPAAWGAAVTTNPTQVAPSAEAPAAEVQTEAPTIRGKADPGEAIASEGGSFSRADVGATTEDTTPVTASQALFSIGSKVAAHMRNNMGGVSPLTEDFIAAQNTGVAITKRWYKWLSTRPTGYKSKGIETMDAYLDAHPDEKTLLMEAARSIASGAFDEQGKLRGTSIEKRTMTTGTRAQYDAIAADPFLSENWIGDEMILRLKRNDRKRLVEVARTYGVTAKSKTVEQLIDGLRIARDTRLKRAIVAYATQLNGSTPRAMSNPSTKTLKVLTDELNKIAQVPEPRFPRLNRSFNQLLFDKMPQDMRESVRREFYAATRDAWEKRTIDEYDFLFLAEPEPDMADPALKVKGIQRVVEKVFEVSDYAVSALKKAQKTMVALNSTVACPMFVIGDNGCWLDACYLTQMAGSAGGLTYYEHGPYTGELLQLPDWAVKLLNKQGGLRVNGLGDTNPDVQAQMIDVIRDAKDRGLQLKIITKQDATFKVVQKAADQGIDVGHVVVQPSMDFLWVPIETDMQSKGSGVWGTVFSPSLTVEENVQRAKDNPDAVAYGYDYTFGREFSLRDGVPMRKFGFSPERVQQLREEYPAVNVMPRFVLTTPQEIAEAALRYPQAIYTLMHGKIDPRCQSDMPGGGYVNFDAARHDVIGDQLVGSIHGKMGTSKVYTAYEKVNTYIHENYTPEEQRIIYAKLKEGVCCQENDNADACGNCLATCSQHESLVQIDKFAPEEASKVPESPPLNGGTDSPEKRISKRKGKAGASNRKAATAGTPEPAAAEPIDTEPARFSVAPDPTKPSVLGAVPMVSMPVSMDTPDNVKAKTNKPAIIDALVNIAQAAGGAGVLRQGASARMRGRTSVGEYDPAQDVIALRHANEVEAAAHEVGHNIDYAKGGWAAQGWTRQTVPSPVFDEMKALGKALYGRRKPAAGYPSEGFAQLVRYYLTDRARAMNEAPQGVAWLENTFLSQRPDIAQAMREARSKIDTWAQAGAVGRVKASTVNPAEMRYRARAAVAWMQDKAKSWTLTHWFDSAHPLALASALAEQQMRDAAGRSLRPSESPHALALALSQLAGSRVSAWVKTGMTDIKGNRRGPSLEEIMSLVQGRQEDFTAYLLARRAVALLTDPHGPRDPGITIDDAERTIADLETPEFEAAALAYYNWNDGVLNYMAQASPALHDIVKAIRKRDPGNYLPLSREVEEELGGAIYAARSGGGSISTGLGGRLKGSGRRVLEPFSQTIRNAERMAEAAHRHVVAASLVRLVDLPGMGEFVRKVTPKVTVEAELTPAELVAKLASLGVTVDPASLTALTPRQWNQTVTFFSRNEKPTGKDFTFAFDRGQGKEYFQVSTDVYNSLLGLDTQRMPALLNLTLGKWSRAFRAGTTGLRASFALANMKKDMDTWMVLTRLHRDPASLMGLWANGLKSVITQDKWVDMAKQVGVDLSQPLGLDIQRTDRAVRDLFNRHKLSLATVRNAFDLYRELIGYSDLAPRLAEMRGVAEAHGIDINQPINLDQMILLSDAGSNATTNFRRAGTMARVVNQVVPFFNAQIQGTSRLGKRLLLDGDPGAWLRAAGLFTLSSLGLWWYNKDEEWWKELPDVERYLADHIRIGDTVLRIPRSNDIGPFFQALPVAIMDAWYSRDPKKASAWARQVLVSFAPMPAPQGLTVAAEEFANQDFFFDRPIVPKSKEKLPWPEQYNEYTSRAAIAIGKVTGLPPARIDHVYEGIFGPFGRDLSTAAAGRGEQGRGSLVDVATRAVTKTDDGQRGSLEEAADLPIIGRFFLRGGTAPYRSRQVDALYDAHEQLQQRAYSEANPLNDREKRQLAVLDDARLALIELSLVRGNVRGDKVAEVTREINAIASDAIAHASATTGTEAPTPAGTTSTDDLRTVLPAQVRADTTRAAKGTLTPEKTRTAIARAWALTAATTGRDGWEREARIGREAVDALTRPYGGSFEGYLSTLPPKERRSVRDSFDAYRDRYRKGIRYAARPGAGR